MAETRAIPPHCEDPSLVISYPAHRGGRMHFSGVSSICFRPYMKHLVSGGADGNVLMWGLQSCHESRRQIRRPYCLQGHKAPVCSVAVSPLDTVVASGSKDKTVRLWIPRVYAKSTVIKGHSGTVRSIAFNPSGEYLLSASDDKCMKVWDVETEKFAFALLGHLNWVRSAEFNNDGRSIVSGSDDRTIRLWDVESRQCIHQYIDILGMVRSARFHPEGKCIASCGTDECIQIWDTRSKRLVQHYAADTGTVNTVSFHPSGDYLLSTCDDGGLRLWDLREGQLLYMLKGHEGSTNCAEFCKSGDFFASGSADEQVVIWRSNFTASRGLYPGTVVFGDSQDSKQPLPVDVGEHDLRLESFGSVYILVYEHVNWHFATLTAKFDIVGLETQKQLDILAQFCDQIQPPTPPNTVLWTWSE
ncbi:POC1 centriolar protein homolog A [Selaginella moellendorffii]|uniref:POC1 centriolar protein homolog A n=1 Tax=Selaginella moellendorffii TaxID=88036 RepID=UPI000D1CE6ED|nr:POC1 centriolar protein homolog A [Selaginella moellendorffii]|eukprot:XP_002984120.2 POC1 centriolar protein homolog A [Selaginella moellendorffii]